MTSFESQLSTGFDVPRYAGYPTMLRLPMRDRAVGLDAGFIGVPFDIGVSNRPGARYAPRAIRIESALPRPYNMATGAAPLESLEVADLGDVAINPHNIQASVEIVAERISEIVHVGCRPLIIGGDHTLLLPHLRAMAQKYGPVGLVHVDSHPDTGDERVPGERITHGTPIRRAVEEELIDPHRVVQIGLHSTARTPDEYAWGERLGFEVITAEQLWHKSATPLMEAVRSHVGEAPVYLTFDIDAIDVGQAPGTGTPELGGLTTIQALEVIRGLRGLDLVGGDLVEVSPPFDPSGATALAAATLLYEMLCVLPGVKYSDAHVVHSSLLDRAYERAGSSRGL